MTTISKSTLDFLKALKKNNNREWFKERKEDFQEEQEMVEASLPGRGDANIVGGGFVDGGLRKRPEDTAKKVGAGY